MGISNVSVDAPLGERSANQFITRRVSWDGRFETVREVKAARLAREADEWQAIGRQQAGSETKSVTSG
jgi:hypothetical protein